MATKKNQAQRKNPQSKSLASTQTGSTEVPQQSPTPETPKDVPHRTADAPITPPTAAPACDPQAPGACGASADELDSPPNAFGTYVDEQNELKPLTEGWLNGLSDRRIFFYPACGFDWTPLHRFTHLCDTFVYCDYRTETMYPADFKEKIDATARHREIGLEVRNVTALHDEAVKLLANPNFDLAQPDLESAGFPHVEATWGKMVELTRHVGGHQRAIHLLYFRAEGVTLYRNLFTKRSIAPRMVCFKYCQDGCDGANWTTFLRWDGPLGRAVWENRVRPEFIVSAYAPEDNAPPDDRRYDWPWRRVWQQHSRWVVGNEVSQLTSYVLPYDLPASAGTPTRYGRHQAEGERTIIKLKRPPHSPANIPAGARVVPLGRQNAPSLGEALNHLSQGCDRDGITDVHSVGCHFEDEAPALYAWKWENRKLRTLTIHCETEGDLACYGPAADEVLD